LKDICRVIKPLSTPDRGAEKTGLAQTQFATLMGVSVRTLQGWEQGRK